MNLLIPLSRRSNNTDAMTLRKFAAHLIQSSLRFAIKRVADLFVTTLQMALTLLLGPARSESLLICAADDRVTFGLVYLAVLGVLYKISINVLPNKSKNSWGNDGIVDE